MEVVPWTLFGLSFLAHAFFLVRRPKHRKPEAKYDLTAQDLLHDLTRRGAAILKVEVIDPSSLMLRSPRG